MISMTNVAKSYQMGGETVRAIDAVDFQINEKEFVAIVGPSGSGKSSLMNILGLLDVPDSGLYLLDGVDVRSLSDNQLASLRNKKIGFIFQNFNLLPKISAFENVKLPLQLGGMRNKEANRITQHYLEKVGLKGREKHLPSQLSGGQQQRVAIARALVCSPEIILADEPTGALDSKTSAEIMDIFRHLHEDGQTVVLITHNPELAQKAQRVVRIVDGKLYETEGGAREDSTNY